MIPNACCLSGRRVVRLDLEVSLTVSSAEWISGSLPQLRHRVA